jgi:hypothetical protein
MIVSLTTDFIANNLLCPEGKRRIEYVEKGGTGLYLEVRATSPGQGTYYLRYKDANGKTRHEKIGRTTDIDLDEARRRAKNLKAGLYLKLSSGIDPRNDAPIKPEVPTVNQYYISDYLPFIKQRNRSWKSADGVYRRYVKPVFGEKYLDGDITRKMIFDWHADLKHRGLSGATADHGLKMYRHLINTAIANEVVTDNPAARVPLFNDFNEINNTLSPEELQRLLTVLTARVTQSRLIARMLLSTPCRAGETLSATRETATWTKEFFI